MIKGQDKSRMLAPVLIEGGVAYAGFTGIQMNPVRREIDFDPDLGEDAGGDTDKEGMYKKEW